MQLCIGSLLVDLNCLEFFDSSFEHELSELGFFTNILLISLLTLYYWIVCTHKIVNTHRILQVIIIFKTHYCKQVDTLKYITYFTIKIIIEIPRKQNTVLKPIIGSKIQNSLFQDIRSKTHKQRANYLLRFSNRQHLLWRRIKMSQRQHWWWA